VPAGRGSRRRRTALAQRLVGDDLAVKPTGPSEPRSAPNAARISSSVAGRTPAERGASFAARAGRRRARARARPCRRPSSTGIAFDVAAASIRGSSASASIVVDARRLDLLRRVERGGKTGRRGTPRATSRSAA
jgi:hypothetical protein